VTAEHTGPPEVEIIEATAERLDDVESLWRAMHEYHAEVAGEAVREVAPFRRAEDSWQRELERRKRRLDAAFSALKDVPTDAPADAMLDFYNELSAAVRGRLDGANTIARVNDALRDVFQIFYLDSRDERVLIIPVLRSDVIALQHLQPEVTARVADGENPLIALSDWLNRVTENARVLDREADPPPLRKILAPSAKLTNAHDSGSNAGPLRRESLYPAELSGPGGECTADPSSFASQVAKVVGAIRASGPGSRTSPAISTPKIPALHVGTSTVGSPRAVRVRRAMSTRS
jgi:hypothetical protein